MTARSGMRLSVGAVIALTAWASVAPAAADDRGPALFEPCRACHALDPAVQGLAGPNLSGLLGRRVGGDPAFDYSPVLRQAGADGQVWNQARLERFLADPDETYPGLWMSMRGIANAADRSALARFLADPASR